MRAVRALYRVWNTPTWKDRPLNRHIPSAPGTAGSHPSRTGLTLLVVLALLTILTLLPVTREATAARLEAASTRALAAFAVARGLNAVISVVQETEVGFSLGVNITAEPGQALDPLNDLVERFSLAALAAAAILGALRLATDLFAWPAVPVALWVWMLGTLALARWWPGAPARALNRALAAVLTAWGFVLLTPLAINFVHQAPPIEARYQAATQAMEQSRERIAALAAERGIPSRADLQRWVDELSALAGSLTDELLTQLSVFLLETLAVPLIVFWILLRVVSGLLRVDG